MQLVFNVYTLLIEIVYAFNSCLSVKLIEMSKTLPIIKNT